MTLAEEKALLARFARAAGAGKMLNIHDLKAAYEKAIGHPTSDSTVFNLLHWHGWRKLMPRPFHPKRDLAAQNAFKKSRLAGKSQAMIIAAYYGGWLWIRTTSLPRFTAGWRPAGGEVAMSCP